MVVQDTILTTDNACHVARLICAFVEQPSPGTLADLLDDLGRRRDATIPMLRKWKLEPNAKDFHNYLNTQMLSNREALCRQLNGLPALGPLRKDTWQVDPQELEVSPELFRMCVKPLSLGDEPASSSAVALPASILYYLLYLYYSK